MFRFTSSLLRANSNLLKGSSFMQRNKLQLDNFALRYLSSSSCLASSGPCSGGESTKKGQVGGGSKSGGKHTITYKPYVAPCYQDHDHKNMGLNRPMSPHLTVYGPTLPAMTSIVQRATGTILTFYALILSGGSLFLSNGVDSIVSIIQSFNFSTFSILILKFLIGFPFTYHYFTGIRFCAWNAGKWLAMKDIYKTAYVAMALAAGAAAFLALL